MELLRYVAQFRFHATTSIVIPRSQCERRGFQSVGGEQTVTASIREPSQMVEPEQAHFSFKRKYWRTSLTSKRTAPVDDVLRAFQAQLLTAQDVADVEERVRDGARLALSLQGRQQEENQLVLQRMVQDRAVVIGALTLAFTAALVISDPSWQLFLLAGAAGLIGMVLVFVTLRLAGKRVESASQRRRTHGAQV